MILHAPSLQPSVLLVADRTLSADYKIMFEGIFGTMQTTQVPEWAMRHFVAPPLPYDDEGRARVVPLGLRRIEASLLADTPLTPKDVVCVTPESLPKLLGPWVKLVMVSSSDPLGGGMSNTTTKHFWKGELYTRHWMLEMMTLLKEAKDRHGFKISVGGQGAWQWVQNPRERERLGVDLVFEGYFENRGPDVVMDILEGREFPEVVSESVTCHENVRKIEGPSMLGVIEQSRGCGKGCPYCTLAFKRMDHLDIDTVIADIETNVAGGIPAVMSGSEDFFRYGGTGSRPNFDELVRLLEAMREVEGLSFMQIDHANISTVHQLGDDQLREVRRLLTWKEPTDFLWVNMGVESANGHLVQANGPAKIAPFRPEDWEEMVKETADRMSRTGFFSVFSVILGLPGETPEDVRRTIELVRYLGTKRAVIFPIFHEPVLEGHPKSGSPFDLETMRLDHLELYTLCYEINFRWVPKLYWDNQRAGGVPLWKRMMIQALGRTEVISWRRNFARVRKAITRRDALAAAEPQSVGAS